MRRCLVVQAANVTEVLCRRTFSMENPDIDDLDEFDDEDRSTSTIRGRQGGA